MERLRTPNRPVRGEAPGVWIPERPAREPGGPSRVRWIGSGAALPASDLPGGVLDNRTFARLSEVAVARMRDAGSPDPWRASDAAFPSERIGVDRRRVLDARWDAGDLACTAAANGLADLGGRPGDALCRRIGLVIVASVSGDEAVPAAATRVVGRLGAGPAVQAFDLQLGCNGFTAALDLARCFLDRAEPGTVAVVVGSETMTRVLHAADRSSSAIFGDGAAALFLERQRRGAPPDPVCAFTLPQGGPRIRIAPFEPERGPVLRIATRGGAWRVVEDRTRRAVVSMDGRRVFRDMVRRLPAAMNAALERRGLTFGDVDQVVFHQANRRLMQAVAEQLELPPGRVPTNIASVGNTTSASIPLLLHELDRAGRLRSGQRLLLVGFGTGYSLGLTTLLCP